VADLEVATVGELATLEVGPEALGRVEIGGVGRQPFDFKPGALGGEVGLHGFAVMAAESGST
jgi:hypothetical protein